MGVVACEHGVLHDGAWGTVGQHAGWVRSSSGADLLVVATVACGAELVPRAGAVGGHHVGDT